MPRVPSHAPRFGFATHAVRLEGHLTRALALEPIPLEAELADRDGRWKGSLARLTASAWRGPSVSFARFVSLSGPALDIGNVLVLPQPPLDAPIFGADLVGVRPDAGLIVADLSPVAGVPPAAASAPLPDWAAGVFSDDPLIERVAADASAAAALARVDAMAERFTASVTASAGAPPSRSPDAIREAHVRYMLAHRRDEKTAAMLGQIFGAAWAAAFVERVLFPVPG